MIGSREYSTVLNGQPFKLVTSLGRGFTGLNTSAFALLGIHITFSTVYNPLLSAEIMNKDLIKVNKWAYQWKMYFNSDITKQIEEVIFSQKSKKTHHPTVHFNHASCSHNNCHKHLRMYLDKKLNFVPHIK